MPQDNESIVSTVSDGDTKEKINISISNLIAKNTNHSFIVRCNSNYRAIFDFDLNSGSNALTWGAADKQAKFVWTAPNGEEETAVKDILFDSDTNEYYCDIPIVENGAECMLIGAIGTSATAHEVVQDKYLIDNGLVDGVEWTATHYHPTQEGICDYIINNNVMGVYIRLPRTENSHDQLLINLSSEIDVSQYDTLYYHVKSYKAPYYDDYGGTYIQMLVNEQSTSLTTGLHKIDITGNTISIEILTAGEYGDLPSTGEDYESYMLFDRMWLTKENVEEEEEEDSSLKNLYTTTSAFVMCVQSIHEVGNPTLGVTDNGASTIDIDDTENAGVRITSDGYLVLNCNQTTPGSGAPGESRPLMTNGEVLTYGVGKVIPHEVTSELDENNNTLINFVYNLAPMQGTGEIIRGPGITNISFDSETGYLTIYYSDNEEFTIEQSLIGPQGPQGPQGEPGQDGEVSYNYINNHFTTSYDSANKKLILNINYPLT